MTVSLELKPEIEASLNDQAKAKAFRSTHTSRASLRTSLVFRLSRA